MSQAAPGARRAVFGLAWLALFAILYTAGEALGLWPQMPPGALRNVDLLAGAAGVAAVCGWLALAPARR